MSLVKAKASKNDEFYTQLSDIENELKHYTDYFKDKIVYCNCDDPKSSNFYKYFSENFEKLHLKKLIVSCYKTKQIDLFEAHIIMSAICLEMTGTNKIITYNLKEDGDFRSQECIEILKQADVIVTNPPFSLFRDYIAQLMKFNKKFLILGSIINATYMKIFPLFLNKEITRGFNAGNMSFQTTNENTKESSFGNICWFTNLPKEKQNKFIECTKKYNSKDYPKYDNYDAININKIKDIPMDYKGKMGVPITFMDRFNSDQFEIIGLANDTNEIHDAFVQGKPVYLDEKHKKFVGMVLKEKNKLRATYKRIIIKHIKPNLHNQGDGREMVE